MKCAPHQHGRRRGFLRNVHAICQVTPKFKAVPWLRRSVAGLSPRRPSFDPGSIHVGFLVDKVALEQVPPSPRVLRFSLSVSIHRCSITRKNRKKHLIIIFTRFHNKSQGCGASVAYAAGPYTTKKNSQIFTPIYQHNFHT